jgi:hypothetical protein
MLSTHERQETADAWWRISRRSSRSAVPSVGSGAQTSGVQSTLTEKIHARISTRWFGLLIVIITYFAGAWLTWRKWPDVLVDFGIQLYLPWSISNGSVLYRDVMHLSGGPLSQYYHALLFSIFGASYLTIVVSNLAIGLALFFLVYRYFLACSDVWTATTISLGVILVFAFNQFSDIGNYNFISPYSHEVWHGTVLSIVAVTFLSRWLVEPKRKFAAGAGFCAGLVFMTKPDVFAALLMAFFAALALVVTKNGVKAASNLVAWALSAALPPVLGFLIYFHRFEDWQTSARSVAFAWVPVLGSSVSNEPFYKWCMGLDVPSYHIRAMLMQFAVVTAVIMTCAIWFRREVNTPTKRLVTVGLIALLVALASGIDWVDCGRSLPLLVLMLGILLAIRYRSALRDKNLADTAERSSIGGASPSVRPTVPDLSLVFPLLWSVFAFGLLAKLGFYTRIWHYGFILAMPAFVAAIYLLLWVLPQTLEKYGVRRNIFRVTIWLLLLTGFLRLFVQSQATYRHKNVPVGHGNDVLLSFDEKVNPAGPAIQSALDWMEKNIPRQSTLAVLPEGAIVNYLGRWHNPTRYLAWDPAQIAGFGQDNMISAFENNSPEYVMLIHRDSFDYGVKLFGQEEKFGLKLMQWIEANYQPVYLIGHEPLRNSLFGIKILKRVSSKESN